MNATRLYKLKLKLNCGISNPYCNSKLFISMRFLSDFLKSFKVYVHVYMYCDWIENNKIPLILGTTVFVRLHCLHDIEYNTAHHHLFIYLGTCLCLLLDSIKSNTCGSYSHFNRIFYNVLLNYTPP